LKLLSPWFNAIKKEQDLDIFLKDLKKEIEELKMVGSVTSNSSATSALFNNKTVNRRLKRGKKKKASEER